MEMESSEYGAFMEKFTLQPILSSSEQLPLNGLTFAVKEIFDVEGQITGFGNPDWAKTHSAATCTAPTVVTLLKAGATCLGKTVMDEMAYRNITEGQWPMVQSSVDNGPAPYASVD